MKSPYIQEVRSLFPLIEYSQVFIQLILFISKKVIKGFVDVEIVVFLQDPHVEIACSHFNLVLGSCMLVKISKRLTPFLDDR